MRPEPGTTGAPLLTADAPPTGAPLHGADAPPHGTDAPPHGVDAAVVRAEDAPGPTLVVRLDRLPPGALASAGELAHLRQALARTPYRDLNKIAVYGPSGRPAGAGLDYRFVQALPDGRFDFRTGCGHSLLACVVAEGRAGPVAVRALTTGDTVLCRPRDSGAYDLDFLRAPTGPGTLPTGRPVDVLDGVPVSLVRYGNPYVLVDVRHLPLPGHADAPGFPSLPGLPDAPGFPSLPGLPDAPGFPGLPGLPDAPGFAGLPGLPGTTGFPGLPGTTGVPRLPDAPAGAGLEGLEARLLRLRARAAVLLGYPPHSPLPKIAAFAPAADGLFVRALTVGGWHPRLALTGAAAFAAAGAVGGTVVPGPVGRIRTPGGTVVVSTGPDRVRVHDKRAHLVDRLRLPWRVHATA
ncbi:hypothetical protein [Streptomyces sp. NPDC053431]|uniref:hypothetical protein n=1 Tax=Streptomyces sp. NPDC053431 TaxID=3365703 RepID=UPI0037CE577F